MTNAFASVRPKAQAATTTKTPPPKPKGKPITLKGSPQLEPKPAKRPRTSDLPDFEIVSDEPLPAKRVQPSKYDPIFERMQPGCCLRVAPEHVSTMAHALTKYIKRYGKRGRVKLIKHHLGDTSGKAGRIWWLDEE